METEKKTQISREIEHEEIGKENGTLPVLADNEIEPIVTTKTWAVVAVGDFLGLRDISLTITRFYHWDMDCLSFQSQSWRLLDPRSRQI